MIISSIELREIRLPLIHFFETSFGRTTERRIILMRVSNADGAEGWAIFKASASMMTQAVKGKTKQETEVLFEEFHRMVTDQLDEESEPNQLGKLKIFAGVREFLVRVRCATLSWHTLLSALHNQGKATTEN